MQYLGTVSKMIEWSLSISKANHSLPQYSKSMPQPNAEEAEVEQSNTIGLALKKNLQIFNMSKAKKNTILKDKLSIKITYDKEYLIDTINVKSSSGKSRWYPKAGE